MKALRTLFLLLVLANLLLYAYGQGHFGRSSAGREPERLDAQVFPERIVLLGHATLPEAPREKPAAPAPAAPVAAAPAEAGATEACKTLAGLTLEQALRVAELTRTRAEQVRLAQRVVEDSDSYWVFLPPAKNRQDLDERIAALKRLGIKDYFVIQDSGPNQLAVSLGIFRNEQTAREGLDNLQRKGVKGARFAPRETPGARVLLKLAGEPAALAALIDEALAAMPGLASAECGAAQ